MVYQQPIQDSTFVKKAIEYIWYYPYDFYICVNFLWVKRDTIRKLHIH